MDALYLTIIGIMAPLWAATVVGLVKARADAKGWEISYQREKERGDRQDEINRDNRLAENIADRLTGGLAKLMARKGGDPE